MYNMSKDVLVVIVVLLLVVGMGMIAYILFSSVIIVPRVSNTTKSMNEYPGYASNIRIARAYYHEPYTNDTNASTDICSSGKDKAIVIMDAIFDTKKMPDSCDVLIDNKIGKHFRLYEIPCTDNCSGEELKIAIDLEKQSIYSEHVLKLCCESVCLSYILPVKCK